MANIHTSLEDWSLTETLNTYKQCRLVKFVIALLKEMWVLNIFWKYMTYNPWIWIVTNIHWFVMIHRNDK